MSGKREPPEGVYGVVPQDPRDMAKAGLLEAQFPVVQGPTRCDHVYSQCHRIRRSLMVCRRTS